MFYAAMNIAVDIRHPVSISIVKSMNYRCGILGIRQPFLKRMEKFIL